MTADRGAQELLNERDYEIGSLKLEIERLRAAISYALLRSPWDSEPTKVQTLKKLSEALYGVVEQNAPTSKCVAEHMGGGRCVGKCLDPKDCCGTPLEQNAVRKCTACDGTGTIEARDGGATCYACGGSGDQRDCYAHPRVPLSDASGNGSDG